MCLKTNCQTKTFSIITLGCPKNEVDSEYLSGMLINKNMRITQDVEQADYIFINTCGFIEDAKKESIDVILNTLELKKKDKNKKVIVWGCLSERYKNQIEKEIPEADGFFGVEPYADIARFIGNNGTTVETELLRREKLSSLKHTAYLKIADGCDHRCTFCAIPMIKGNYRSSSLHLLKEEAEWLVSGGVKELILVAQDTTAYGSDLHDGVTLASLVKELATIDGLQWIRIMYGHPAHLSDAFINLMAEEEKICRYIDLPLQHISDDVLKSMGRGTQKRDIVNLIDKIRIKVQGVAIRTTFIVGFPGETNVHFDELKNFVKDTQFERMGVFRYSPEEGTQSFDLKSVYSGEVAFERYHELMAIQQRIAIQKNKKLKLMVIPVLIDGYDEPLASFYGRTEWDGLDIDQMVWINSGQSEMIVEQNKQNKTVGTIYQVKIENSSAYDVTGSIIY